MDKQLTKACAGIALGALAGQFLLGCDSAGAPGEVTNNGRKGGLPVLMSWLLILRTRKTTSTRPV
jgi:hypothetical protein